jgi:ABC-type glycerol-3-phosphate transport system substrate-binding protein
MKALCSLFLIIVTAVFLAGCGKAAKSTGPSTDLNQPSVGLPALKQAVQSFNTQEGHYPKTLDELVPKYIAKIPDAPGGYKYVYDSATGEVKLSR